MEPERYKYKRIDLATDAIRLVRLCKGYHTDPIRCSMFETYLHQVEGVPYDALSYCWGDRAPEVDIILDGKALLVTGNLHNALRCLRRADRDRLLWIDAVCIDQANDREKGHQVGQMRLIYKNADSVLVWLGSSNDDIDLLMEMMGQLDRRAVKRADYRKNSPDAWRNEWSVLLGELGGDKTPFYGRRRDGLADLLRRPWFRRVWILQEVASARAATILCGWNAVPTRTFVLMPTLLNVPVEGHTQAVLDIMPGHLRRESWWGEKNDLSTLIRKFGSSLASDQRDNVYALLGIASDAGHAGFPQPDYEITLAETMSHTVMYLVFGDAHTAAETSFFSTWGISNLCGTLDRLPVELLEWALSHDCAPLLRLLLQRGIVDVNRTLTKQGTALSFLVDRGPPGHLAALKVLLEWDQTDVNIVDSIGDTPLIMAARDKNHAAKLQLLLDHKAIQVNLSQNGRMPPLAAAAYRGCIDQVALLLSHGNVEIDKTSGTDSEEKTYCTALWFAATRDHSSVVELLAACGANLEKADTLGRRTALWIAAQNGNVATVKILLDRGANKEARNGFGGVTPLRIALAKKRTAVVKLLLDRGADINTKDAGGRPLLGFVAYTGDVDSVDMLLGYGTANLEATDDQGQTPLLLAAKSGRGSIVRLLLQKGANIEARDRRHDMTSLWIAARLGHLEAVRALLESEVSPDLEARCGRDEDRLSTPLWVAARHGNASIAKLLVEHGASLQAVGGADRVPAATMLERLSTSEDAKAALPEPGADASERSKRKRFL